MFDASTWAIRVDAKGGEQEPVVVIDGFASEPAELIDQAAASTFSAMSPYYPGVRAALDAATATSMISALTSTIAETFGVASPVVEGCFFSVVTTPRDKLAPIQRLPHYDGVERGRLAMILYLCAPMHGGTSFYRHRSTGFETVTPERFARYRDALADDVRRHGMPPADYIAGDTALFERIGTVTPAFNRAVLYRGCSLHSGDIGSGFRFDPDPRSGRLTLNAFILGQTQPPIAAGGVCR
jgi:hypothetical protein